MVVKRENLDKTSTSKLACMYKESTKEASVYAREEAEEDANSSGHMRRRLEERL